MILTEEIWVSLKSGDLVKLDKAHLVYQYADMNGEAVTCFGTSKNDVRLILVEELLYTSNKRWFSKKRHCLWFSPQGDRKAHV